VWIALEQGHADGRGVEQVLAHLQAVVHFTQTLDGRLAAEGTGGITGTLALYRRLQGLLDAVRDHDLATMQEQVATLASWLATVAQKLDEIARLKAALRA
jgi:hypothetical protein